MPTDDATSPAPIFAYLTVWEHAEHGFFGGYLIVCEAGRPLEFHCSAPIKPSRAQEILYGPTLRPYLLGQQIAGGLLASAQLKPRLILTDHPDILVLSAEFDGHLLHLLSDTAETAQAPNVTSSASRQFCCANYRFELPPGCEADGDDVRPLLETLAASVDLAEPFERIQLAIREAQRIGESEDEADARAA